jgi:hypothetical protein
MNGNVHGNLLSISSEWKGRAARTEVGSVTADNEFIGR